MNSTRTILTLALAIGALPATSLKARAAEEHFLKLKQNMVVAGVNLRAGTYDVRWELQDTRATVTLARKGRVVATVLGVVSSLDKTVDHDTLFVSKHPDGFIAINGLGFAGSNRDIIFPAYPAHPRAVQTAQSDETLNPNGWRAAEPARPLLHR